MGRKELTIYPNEEVKVWSTGIEKAWKIPEGIPLYPIPPEQLYFGLL